jgi:hypothetical protein
MKFAKRKCCNLRRVSRKNSKYLQIEYHTYKGKYFSTLHIYIDLLNSTANNYRAIDRLFYVQRVLHFFNFLLVALRFVFRSSTALSRSFEKSLRHIKLGRIPLDGWSARRWDLYLTTHNTQTNRHPCPRWDSKSNRSKLTYADPSLRPPGHRDRPIILYSFHLAICIIQ